MSLHHSPSTQTTAPRTGQSVWRALLFAGMLAGIPASTQPAPQAQVLPALPTLAAFRATVHAHAEVINTWPAYVAALNNLRHVVLAHGPDSPQAAEALAAVDMPRQTWVDSVMDSYTQEVDLLRDQGHSLLAIQAAYPIQSLLTGP